MSIAIVNSNKTLGVGDDGTLQEVTGGYTITIPNDSTWEFMEEDIIPIFSTTTSTINITVEAGVTLRAKDTKITTQYGHVNLEKEGNNTWIAWGDLG